MRSIEVWYLFTPRGVKRRCSHRSYHARPGVVLWVRRLVEEHSPLPLPQALQVDPLVRPAAPAHSSSCEETPLNPVLKLADPRRHMHGAMRSPALEKQKRHTDSVASNAPPSPAPEPTVESEAERVAVAAPPPSPSLPNSCRQSGLRALKAADRPANCSLSAAVALSEPMASDSY